MSDPERVARTEEHLMRLQQDQEQLDGVVRAQADTIDRLLERLEQLEQRLERLERGGD